MKNIYVLTIVFSILFCLVFTVAFAKEKGNPLLKKWKGPFQGVPPLDKIKVKHFAPAMKDAMAANRKEIRKISKNPEPPTFQNTILAYENCGELFSQVASMYELWSSAKSTPKFKKVEAKLSPKLAAFSDEIIQNPDLFRRVESVRKQAEDSPSTLNLSGEEKRLLEETYLGFVRHGARLNESEKKRVAAINQELASLETKFSQNLAEEEKSFVVIEKKEDLEGLPEARIKDAAADAETNGLKGKWVITNTRSSVDPFLTFAANRDLREKVFRMSASRGDNDNNYNNNQIASKILDLRAERSKIFGYKSYAHWKLEDTMAKDPQAAMDLMMQIWKPAVKKFKEEVSEIAEFAKSEGQTFRIEPWDFRYYAEKVRKKKYSFDNAQLEPYLTLENVQKAMFAVANKLFGFEFFPADGIPVYDAKMSVYEVKNSQGRFMGVWYFDPFAREGTKNSGAWMSNYRSQYKMKDGKKIEDMRPIVSNNSNFKGQKGQSVPINWDEALTMFHEFGHALHGLASDVNFRTLSGTALPSDFVELPSQFFEHYLLTPFAVKFLVDKDGNTIPDELVARMNAARNSDSGFISVEFLASAIVDMKLHLSNAKNIDLKAFEAETLKEIGMPHEVIMRHRIPHFAHIFGDEGYAAGYYGYLWSQVLDNDAFEAFTETGNPNDPVVARKFYDSILAVGNSRDPAVSYREFRGRDAKVDALLRHLGF